MGLSCICKQTLLIILQYAKSEGELRPGQFHHMICGTVDVTDFRRNSLFTFISTATQKLENQNKFQRRCKSYLFNTSGFEA